jgi:hypothetical protein
MRGIVTYLMAGILVVLALEFVAPPVGLGLVVGATPVTERGMTTQFVDRTHKGDRLSQPAAVYKQPVPSAPPKIMIGCDPTFSPLSASARASDSGRCIAELAHPLAA